MYREYLKYAMYNAKTGQGTMLPWKFLIETIHWDFLKECKVSMGTIVCNLGPRIPGKEASLYFHSVRPKNRLNEDTFHKNTQLLWYSSD